MTTNHAENLNNAVKELIRPSLTFESITFSDGQTLTFEDDEIVVFVGPNNAGIEELPHITCTANCYY